MPKARDPQRPVLIEYTSPHLSPGERGEMIAHGKTYLVDIRDEPWNTDELFLFTNSKSPREATPFTPAEAKELIETGTWKDARMVDAARAKPLSWPEGIKR